MNVLPEAIRALGEYRRLVRENVLPPAEPDQDTLDARAVLRAWNPRVASISGAAADWDRVKQALTEIKARVRREAIQALPDAMTPELLNLAPLPWIDNQMTMRVIAAIKKVYG